ncbi:MAG: hypothetical protein CMP23_09945 [Rickettsiales bacterium]|nr:hypothetical protein [Rickettsiales bacterium]|tara:strand:- start:323 stop:1603 length:1281 start_codon:yes stop_codon:yes gene_type:complete
MSTETAIRTAAIALLIGVVIVSYLQWGKGVEKVEAPSGQQFKSEAEIAAAGAANEGNKNKRLPAGGGYAKGQEGPEGSEGLAPNSAEELPSGAGWKEGEVGPEGGEGLAPNGTVATPEGGGWKAGEEGPAGTEGVMPDGEPANESAVGLCWQRAAAGSDYSYRFSGSVETGAFPDEGGVQQHWAVVAVDRPISQWTAGTIVKVHGFSSGVDSQFNLNLTSSASELHLCAVWPANLGQFQGIRVASCLDKPLKSGKEGAAYGDLTLKPVPLRSKLLVISGSDLQDSTLSKSRVQRTLSGNIVAPELKGASFMVAAAASPILDQEGSQEDPRAVVMTNAKGAFKLRYMAAAEEPLFLCAMAFPGTKSLSEVKGLEGQGCVPIQIAADELVGKAVELSGLEVPVNAEKMPLAPHELDHISLISRCFRGS